MELLRITWQVTPEHPLWSPQWTSNDFFPPPGAIHEWLCIAAGKDISPTLTRYGIVHIPLLPPLPYALPGNLFWYLTNPALHHIARRLAQTLPNGSFTHCLCPVRRPATVVHTICDFPRFSLPAPVIALPTILNHSHSTFRTFYLIRSPHRLNAYLPTDPQLRWGILLHDFATPAPVAEK